MIHTFENQVRFNKKFIPIIKHVISKNNRSNKTRFFSTGISENKGQSSQKLHYQENWRAWCSTRINEIVQASHRDAEDAKDLAKEITEPVMSALQPITEGVRFTSYLCPLRSTDTRNIIKYR